MNVSHMNEICNELQKYYNITIIKVGILGATCINIGDFSITLFGYTVENDSPNIIINAIKKLLYKQTKEYVNFITINVNNNEIWNKRYGDTDCVNTAINDIINVMNEHDTSSLPFK